MSIVDYAGLWLRLTAFVIDSIVLSVIYLLLIIPLYDVFWPTPHHHIKEVAFDGGPDVVITGTDTFLSRFDFSQLILLVLAFVYYSLMESSRYQASVGKLALELKVTDTRGGRLGFFKSSLRNASKLISVIPLLTGFIAIAFTPKRQAWHDMIADAVVVQK